MLPTEGMILGGNLTLQGQNLSLACFHGINFRSKAWAIFTMNDVYISFATEAQKTQDQGMAFENEPWHDKTNKMSVCPAKTQISQVRVFTVRWMDG